MAKRDPQLVLPKVDSGDLQWPVVADFELPCGTHHIVVEPTAAGDAELDSRGWPLQQQVVIAWRQTVDHQETVPHRHLIEAVGHKPVATQFQQRHVASRRLAVGPFVGDLNRCPGQEVHHAVERVASAAQRPRMIGQAVPFGGDQLNVGQLAQGDSAIGIRLQRDVVIKPAYLLIREPIFLIVQYSRCPLDDIIDHLSQRLSIIPESTDTLKCQNS